MKENGAKSDKKEVCKVNNLTVKSIPFLGNTLMAAKDETTGKVFAGVSYICRGIGLSKDQKDNEVRRVQRDIVLLWGCVRFDAGVFDPNNEAVALDIDYIPLWLAKISITPAMQREQPEVAERLVKYQLKAKDVLAAAFLGTRSPTTAMEMIRLQNKAMVELDDRLATVEDKLENQMTIDHNKQRTIQNLVASRIYKRIQENVKIGFENNIQKCRPFYFQSLYRDLKNRFGVASYRDIRISQYDDAVNYVNNWIEPADLRVKAS